MQNKINKKKKVFDETKEHSERFNGKNGNGMIDKLFNEISR